MIPATARDLIRDLPLGIIASADAAGVPQASPKGTFLVLDDRTIAYGDIRSPGTAANLAARPETEVVFVDPYRRKGVRIAGRARIVANDEREFADLIPRWREVWGDLADRIGAIVVIDATRVRAVTTPPYDDGATEEDMIALYRAKFAALYPEDPS